MEIVRADRLPSGGWYVKEAQRGVGLVQPRRLRAARLGQPRMERSHGACLPQAGKDVLRGIAAVDRRQRSTGLRAQPTGGDTRCLRCGSEPYFFSNLDYTQLTD